MSEYIPNRNSTSRSTKTLKEYEKNEAKERKRNMLYLILNYLREQNMLNSANALANEAQLTNQFELCDNIDLDIILQDYQSYYQTRFNKMPKIVKKVVADEIMLSKTIQSQRKKTKSALTIPSNEKTASQQSSGDVNTSTNGTFDITIKALGRGTSHSNEVCHEYEKYCETIPSAKEFCDSKNYNQEWREMVDLIMKEIVPKKIATTWNDCVGVERSIEVIKEAVVYPIRYPHFFTGLVTPWRGVLLFGPPGTGKTQLAKAVASESSSTFISVRSSSITSKWRGESEKMLKILFEIAKFYQPTTIFIDEIDSIASKYEDSQHDAARRFKSELLIEMDGILSGDDQIFVLATTNSPWSLDSALLRRFEKRILLSAPSKEARQELFHYFFSKQSHEFQEKDFEEMAHLTEYFTGSDIKTICKEVVMNLVREKLRNNAIGANAIGIQMRKPTLQDVIESVGKTTATINASILEKYKLWYKNHGSN